MALTVFLIFFNNLLDVTNDTTHYKILLRFKKDFPLEMLETNDKIEIKKQFVEIKTYLNQKIPDFTRVAIED